MFDHRTTCTHSKNHIDMEITSAQGHLNCSSIESWENFAKRLSLPFQRCSKNEEFLYFSNMLKFTPSHTTSIGDGSW